MIFGRRVKEYGVAWRHRRLDTADHPFRGGGLAYGRNQREALFNYFCRRRPGGCTQHLHEIDRAYRAGEIEILKLEVRR